MALEGVKSDKSEENNGTVPNGIDNKSKQVWNNWLFYLFRFGYIIFLHINNINNAVESSTQ